MENFYKKWEECLKHNLGRKLKRLRYTRFEEALSIRYVCKNIPIELQPIELSNIEKGLKGTSFDKLIAILNFYNVSMDWLINGDIDTIPVSATSDIEANESKESLKANIVDKLLAITKSEDYFIVDNNLSFAIEYPKYKREYYIKGRDKTKKYRLFTLMRFCHYHNIDFGWLISGNIKLVEQNKVPVWKEPVELTCKKC